jgi:hypothetical protein
MDFESSCCEFCLAGSHPSGVVGCPPLISLCLLMLHSCFASVCGPFFSPIVHPSISQCAGVFATFVCKTLCVWQQGLELRALTQVSAIQCVCEMLGGAMLGLENHEKSVFRILREPRFTSTWYASPQTHLAGGMLRQQGKYTGIAPLGLALRPTHAFALRCAVRAACVALSMQRSELQ